MTITVEVEEARNTFADLLASVHYRDETVMVERAGKPFAVLISPAAYERYTALVRARAIQATERVYLRNEQRDPQEAEREVARVIEEVR